MIVYYCTNLFAKCLLGRMNSQISIFTYLLILASIGKLSRLVKVVLPQAFWAWVGAAHIIDKKAHKWSYFILWANKCACKCLIKIINVNTFYLCI